MWYYLVAAFVLTANGQQALIRAVGPFQLKEMCETARHSENPALWVGDECFEAFMESQVPKQPPWFGRAP